MKKKIILIIAMVSFLSFKKEIQPNGFIIKKSIEYLIIAFSGFASGVGLHKIEKKLRNKNNEKNDNYNNNYNYNNHKR